MKILVTGGAGYIGSVCVEQWLNQDFDVVVFDNLSEGFREAVDPRATFIQGDLTQREDIFQAMAREKPEAVMHFAASALVGESMENPSKYYRNNVGGGIHLLEAMVENGVKKIVFSSTCATYGIPSEIPIHEEALQNPINPYGHSKWMFEQMLDWYEKIHGITRINLRYFNAAGASEKYGEAHRIETHLIPNVLQVALGQKEKIIIFGQDYPTPDGTCIRDYIHILDLAQAHLLALHHPTSASYNLGTGEGFSVRQVIEVARKITGHSIPEVVYPRREGDPPRLVAYSQKIIQELDWNPKNKSLESILESAWCWHQSHPYGYSPSPPLS